MFLIEHNKTSRFLIGKTKWNFFKWIVAIVLQLDDIFVISILNTVDNIVCSGVKHFRMKYSCVIFLWKIFCGQSSSRRSCTASYGGFGHHTGRIEWSWPNLKSTCDRSPVSASPFPTFRFRASKIITSECFFLTGERYQCQTTGKA